MDYRTLRAGECVAAYAGAHDIPVSVAVTCASCVARTGMCGGWVCWGDPPTALVHATDPDAERIAELHVLQGESPDDRPVHAGRGTLAAAPGCPGCREPAARPGPLDEAAVVAVPILLDRRRIGLFGLYSHHAATLSAEQHREVEAFAAVALELLLESPSATVDGERWLAEQAVVYQASGMVSVQLGVDVDESLVRLRARAFAEGKPLSEIARAVVGHRLNISPESP